MGVRIKYRLDGSLERYKARLVAKGFTQTYNIDYLETFAPVAKLNTMRVLLSLAANLDWPLQQLDVKNVFLNGEEEVYMDSPPGFDGRFGSKQSLSSEFEIKDLGSLRYFLGMEVTQSKKGIVVLQRKYVLDFLKEIGMSDCRPVDIPIDPNQKLGDDKECNLVDTSRYQRLLGKLIYLSHTQPDIAFVVTNDKSIHALAH
ncbi:Retrovirus-related Pol polyprotein from transposon RE2 [Vitis vinifera]|uniref:Retrovirus-related Pol polyprotein from transposon RE2 n=1 Tax=Vitis vinifera TaxID=29760 RepID=A0A438KEQ7_VITVI|nr:Retrovirus-related Pol polyprotein from transposon RE2 [Vitis vinifera]